MIAPPGNPKMVETPSSTSDWQIALAPFKRIDVLTYAERTIALLPASSSRLTGTQKTPPPTEARSLSPRGNTLLGPIPGAIIVTWYASTLCGPAPAPPGRPH